jgi:hypothetical protein
MDINVIKRFLEMVVSFVLGKENPPRQQPEESPKLNLEKKFVLTLNDLLTSSGKYPKRVEHVECTEEVIANATVLLEKVNALLTELNITNVKVSSGFRPSDVNGAIPNAAKKSLHMTGKAIDLDDKDGAIDKAISEKPELLKKHGLWLESPDNTPNWCHLDNGTRTDRPIRIFKP